MNTKHGRRRSRFPRKRQHQQTRGANVQHDERTREILRYFEPVVDCVADLFGPSCEVVLHDVRDPVHSVVKIRNGHVTGRTIGSPLTDLGMEILGRDRRFTRETLGIYRTTTDEGHTLSSNAVMIRNAQGEIVGMLCINWDVTPLLAFQHVLRNGHRGMRADGNQAYKEHHARSVPGLIRSLIRDAIRRDAQPNIRMDKAQKMRVVRELYHKGIFNTRGAVPLVARALNISNVSVYKYLEEIRH